MVSVSQRRRPHGVLAGWNQIGIRRRGQGVGARARRAGRTHRADRIGVHSRAAFEHQTGRIDLRGERGLREIVIPGSQRPTEEIQPLLDGG